MAFGDIPIRENGKDFLIDASWFNSIRTELVNAFGTGGYITEAAPQAIANGGEVTVDPAPFKPLIPVSGSGGAITTSLTPFGTTHGYSGGKEIILIGTDDTNTVTIPHNDATDGVVTDDGNDIVLEQYSYVLLIYNENTNRFIAATSGSKTVGFHENIGTGNGVATDFSVTKLPSSEDSFIVYKNSRYVPRDEYTFTNPTITFNTAPPAGTRIDVFMLTSGGSSVLPASGDYQVEYKEIDAAALLAKEVTLAAAPTIVGNTVVDVVGGSSTRYGVDFSVSGTTLTWNGLGLDGVLTNGDYLRITYIS